MTTEQFAQIQAAADQNNAFYGIADDVQVIVHRIVTYTGAAVDVKKQLAQSLPVGNKMAYHSQRPVTIHVEQTPVKLARGILMPREESEVLDAATIRWRHETGG